MAGGLIAGELELGPCSVYLYEKPKAALITALVGEENDIRLEAVSPGVAGNDITLTLVDPAGNDVPLSVVVTGTDVIVTLATGVAGAIESTAADVVAAINAAARGLVTATFKTGEVGTGLVTALVETPLTGGTDVEEEVHVGYLGDGTQVEAATTATPLLGAQAGDIPLDKVVSGGTFRITIPLRQFNLDNYRRAFPNTLLFSDGAGNRRLEFIVRVGQSMREQAVKMIIKKFKGGAESSNPYDWITIPAASPVDGSTSLAFSPTGQREMTAVYEAWPDSRGLWAFIGPAVL